MSETANIIRFYFWRMYPAPKIGERWVHADEQADPWNERHYTITKQCGNWYRVRASSGYEESKERQVLVAFYRKIADAPIDNDEPPW